MHTRLWLAALLALAVACGDDTDTPQNTGTSDDGSASTDDGAADSEADAVMGDSSPGAAEDSLPPNTSGVTGPAGQPSAEPGDEASEPVFCTLEVREPDGICPPGDDCDPDCSAAGDDPIACPTVLMLADGECDESDPCALLNDEDCLMQGPPDDIVCPAIYIEPDGVCPDDPCDPDC